MKNLVDFINESNVNEYLNTFKVNGKEKTIPSKPGKLKGDTGLVYSKENKCAVDVWIDKNNFLVVDFVRDGKSEIIGYVYYNSGEIETFDDRVDALDLNNTLDRAFQQAANLYDGGQNDLGWPVPCYWKGKTYER